MSYLAQPDFNFPDFQTRQNSWTQTLIPSMSDLHKSHFWDWFDADVLSAIWNQNNGSGAGTFAMVDAVDEGFSITTGGSAGNNSEISMGNIQHYDAESFEQYSVWRRVAGGNGQVAFGVTDEPDGILGSSVNDQYDIADNVPSTNKILRHNLTATSPASTLDLGVAIDVIFHLYKIEGKVGSGFASIDGILRGTVTTDLPTGEVQPALFCLRGASATPQEGRISYMEILNK